MANKTKSIVFVDAGIEAPLQLVAGIDLDAETLILPPDSDGVAYIATALQVRADATEVFVVAHGAPGQVSLGNASLSLSTLPQYRDRLQQWTAQTAIQDIHFYGCHVAAGDAGAEFLSAIHAITHANIAASTHLLGHADRGGDWTLDAFWGEVERRNLLLTAEAAATYPGTLAANNDIQNAIALAPGTPDVIGNALANNQAGEPIHDSTPGATNLSNDSVWWTWTSNVDGLVNVNTEGSTIGTALAVYSSPVAATDPTFTFGSLSPVANDLSASGGETTSVSFEAQNGVIYYFAVDGTGFQQTATDTAGITIQLAVPPQITAAQLFPVSELAVGGDAVGTVALDNAVTVDTWAIAGGNPDNDGDGTLAFAIDGTGAITVNDADDLDFEVFPQNYELTIAATNGADTDTESVFVQVADVNEDPVITSLSAPGTVNEGQLFTLTGQIDDPDISDTAKVEITWGDATTTTVFADSSGEFSASHAYTDDTAFTAGEISVTVTDSGGLPDTTTRAITVNNVAPTVTPSISPTFSLAEDGTRSFFLTAADPAGAADPFTWSVTTPSAGGTLTPPAGAAATQFFTYTPELNFNGTETFEITVKDDDGGSSTVSFNVDVTPIADAPTNLNLSASANTIEEGDSITLSGNFTDPDIDDTFTVTIDWSDGTAPTELNSSDLAFNPISNKFSFSAEHDFLTNDDVSVVVTVVDSFGKQAIASEAITINNAPPEVTPSSFLTIDEDTTGTLTLTASDISSDTFNWSIDTLPANGTASVTTADNGATQTVTYTPTADFFGGDNFIVKVGDGDGGFAFASIGVNVNPVNDAPINLTVTPDATSINEGDTVTLSGSFEDIDNSTEVDLDDVHSITVDWGDGTVETFNDTDATIFTGATDTTQVDFSNLAHTYLDEGDGTYTVKVTVTDAEGATDDFTTEIQVANVAPTLDTPATSPAQLAVVEDTSKAFTVSAADVGMKDILTWSVIAGPSNGSLTLGPSPSNGTQNFTYTPDANFDGDGDGATFNDDTFTLQVRDGDGGFVDLLYNVGIDPVADRPDITVNSFTVVEDQVLQVTGDVLNAIDEDTLPANLTFTISGTDAGSFFYDDGTTVAAKDNFTLDDIFQGKVTFLYENANDTGAPNFTITLADDTTPTVLTDIAAGNIVDFTAVNDAPELVLTDADPGTPDVVELAAFSVKEGGQVAIPNTLISATDEESGAANLTFTLTDIEGGDFVVSGQVKTSFTLAQVNAGAVFFQHDGTEVAPQATITVTDGDDRSSPSQVIQGTIGTPVNDPPTILVNNFDVTEGEELLVTTKVLDAIDVDATAPTNDILFTIGGANAGSFLVDGIKDNTFTRDEIAAGKVTFLYDGETEPVFTITANDGETVPAEVTVAGNVTFTEVNDTPIFQEPDGAGGFITITDGTLPDITVNEDGNVSITRQIIKATDGDFDDRNLQFTVSNIQGGDFFLVGSTTPVTTFTQNDINLGRVFFENDGSETPPSYDISVTDGDNTATATGGGTVNGVNDAPELVTNEFNITEGVELTITTDILDATDVDSENSDIEFAITGTDLASFKVDGVALTGAANTFTRQDIIDGKVTLLFEGEVDPEFTITVTDQRTDATPNPISLPPVDGNVTFTPVNDAPTLTIATPIAITEDAAIDITTVLFAATDAEVLAGLQPLTDLVYTINATTNGTFQLNGVDATTFTQADIGNDLVDFVHSGEAAPSFTVTLNDNGSPTAEEVTVTVDTTDFTFTPANDLPVLGNNSLTVNEGGTVTLTTADLSATDIETKALNLRFEITDVTNGQFSIDGGVSFAPGNVTFSLLDIIQEQVLFKHDESNEDLDPPGDITPSYKVTVIDRGLDGTISGDDGNSNPAAVAANITFNEVNDTPELAPDSDGAGIANDPFEINEGQVLVLNNPADGFTNIVVTDPDTPPEDITLTASNVVGGFFATTDDTETAITSFTLAELNSLGIVFNHDGSETAPAFTLKADDGNSTDLQNYVATFEKINDAPEITTNTLTITEDERVVLTIGDLTVVDPESGPANLKYSITNLTKGSFLIDDGSGNFATEIATDTVDAFTQQQVIDGLVAFKQGGSNDSPTYTLTAKDNGTPQGVSVASDAKINFTPINDAPELAPGTTEGLFTIQQGEKVTIDGATQLSFVDEETFDGTTGDPALLTYTIDAVNKGTFFLNGTALAVNDTFTQQDLNLGSVAFQHDNSEFAPSYTVTVSDNGVPAPVESTTLKVVFQDGVDFINLPNAPELLTNTLTIDEGQTVEFTTTNLSAEDLDSPNLDLKFLITDLDNGEFTVDGAVATDFTLREVVEGLVSFTHDGTNDAPTYKVQVSDGTLDSGTPVLAPITFNRENDNPTLISPDGPQLAADLGTTDDLAQFQFEVKENGSLGLTLDQIDAADELGETAQSDLTFEVAEVKGGFFALSTSSDTAIADNKFTWVQVDNGDIVFNHDGSNVAPSYQLTVFDDEGGSTTATYTGTLTAVNDEPVLKTAQLSLMEIDDGTGTPITAANLLFEDEETAPANLKYEIISVGPDGATDAEDAFFTKNGTRLNVGDSFSQADVNNGLIAFVQAEVKNNDAPTFKLQLTDQAVLGDPTSTISTIDIETGDNFTLDFTAVNDEPTPDPFVINFPTVVEGGTIAVVSGVTTNPGEVQIFVTDEETTNPAELVYTVDSIANASFEVSGSNATTFTQDDIDNGRVTFVHDDSELEPTFTLSVQDNNGGTGAKTLTQAVEPLFQLANEAPELTKNTLSPIEGQEITLTTDNIFASDREDIVTQLKFEISDVLGGTFFLNDVALDVVDGGDGFGQFSIAQLAAGELTFKDDGDENAPSYKVNVIDSKGAELAAPEAATIDLSQFPVNDAPEITVVNFPIVEGQILELNTTILDTVDLDNAATELTYSVSNLTGGEFLLFDSTATPPALSPVTTFTQQDVIDGLVNFQPDDSDSAPSFTLTVSDGGDVTDTVNVSEANGNITFTPVNDAPVAVADSFTTDEDTQLTSLNVTANDTDDSGTPLQVTKIDDQVSPVTTAKGATVEIVGNLINYDPGTAFQDLGLGATDTDTFTYTINDTDPDLTDGKTATGTVTITIEGKNDLPTLDTATLTATATEGTPLSLNVLTAAGAKDVDFGDVLTIDDASDGTFGTVTFTNDTLTYTPTGDLLGGDVKTDTLTYTVSDGNGGTVDGTVEVTLTGVNDPPIAVANSGVGFRTVESAAFRTGNVLNNDSDPELGPLTIKSVDTTGLQGSLVNRGDGTFTYDPNGVFDALPVGKTRNDVFSYTIEDDQGATASTTVSIQVTGQLSSFLDYEKQLQLQNLNAVAPGNVIDVLPLAQLYDEQYYLNQNPDIAALVGSTFSSGFQHFVNFGVNEGRNPSVLYNESFYLANNNDVRNAVTSGAVSSGLVHFLTSGHREGRDPSAFFDQSDYLLNNPDVDSAVDSGALVSAFQHYVIAGVDENRLPALSLFDAQYYLDTNPQLVQAGVTQADAFDHFQQFGQFEGRRGSAAYRESSYLSLNNDVSNAVTAGALPNGFQHFEAVGRFEGRFVLPV